MSGIFVGNFGSWDVLGVRARRSGGGVRRGPRRAAFFPRPRRRDFICAVRVSGRWAATGQAGRGPARWFGRRRPVKRWRDFDTRPGTWASSRWRSVPGTGTRPRGASPRDSSRWRPTRSTRFACGITGRKTRAIPARPAKIHEAIGYSGGAPPQIRGVAWSPDADRFATFGAKHVKLWTPRDADANATGARRQGAAAGPPKPRGDAQPPPQPRAESPRTRDTRRVCACATTETATGTARRRRTRAVRRVRARVRRRHARHGPRRRDDARVARSTIGTHGGRGRRKTRARVDRRRATRRDAGDRHRRERGVVRRWVVDDEGAWRPSGAPVAILKEAPGGWNASPPNVRAIAAREGDVVAVARRRRPLVRRQGRGDARSFAAGTSRVSRRRAPSGVDVGGNRRRVHPVAWHPTSREGIFAVAAGARAW